MIVLDANILIRAVLGRRVRQLIETYGVRGARFFAPDVAFGDAASYLPPLLEKRGKQDVAVSAGCPILCVSVVCKGWGFRFNSITTLGAAAVAFKGCGS